MKEDDFLRLINEILPESRSYLGDDAAYIPDRDLILTQDTLVEDIHFKKSYVDPYNLGVKSMAVNLSDIAACGGIPLYALVSLSLPEETKEDFVRKFYEGMRSLCTKYNVLIVGGDITGSTKIVASITIIGSGMGIAHATRNNAKVGDFVVVTGEYGSSIAGMWLLKARTKGTNATQSISQELQDKLVKAHINPIPFVKEGRTIVENAKTPPALMDASDGLANALYKIAFESKVSMKVDYNKVPIEKNLYFIADIAGIELYKWVLYGGEDYGLVGTLSKDSLEEVLRHNVPLTVIGKVIKSEGEPVVRIKFEDSVQDITAETLGKESFNHFNTSRKSGK